MFTVKKLSPRTVLSQRDLNIQTSKFVIKAEVVQTKGSVVWAVIDSDGNVTMESGEHNIFPRKATAQMLADAYNSK